MPINNELKTELVYNYLICVKMIDHYDNDFRNFVKNNKLNNEDYEMSRSLFQKGQLFHKTLAMLYIKLIQDELNGVQATRRILQNFANIWVEEREIASNICGGENQYLYTCNNAKEKLDGIDGYIALVC